MMFTHQKLQHNSQLCRLINTPSDFLSHGLWREEHDKAPILMIALLIAKYYNIKDHFSKSPGYNLCSDKTEIIRTNVEIGRHYLTMGREILDPTRYPESLMIWNVKIRDIVCLDSDKQEFLIGIIEKIGDDNALYNDFDFNKAMHRAAVDWVALNQLGQVVVSTTPKHCYFKPWYIRDCFSPRWTPPDVIRAEDVITIEVYVKSKQTQILFRKNRRVKSIIPMINDNSKSYVIFLSVKYAVHAKLISCQHNIIQPVPLAEFDWDAEIFDSL